jgi:hypothetical protein
MEIENLIGDQTMTTNQYIPQKPDISHITDPKTMLIIDQMYTYAYALGFEQGRTWTPSLKKAYAKGVKKGRALERKKKIPY